MNCPKCNQELNENQKFCTNCGTEINNAETISLSDKIKSLIETKAFKISLMVSSIVLVLILLAFVVVNINTKEISTYKSVALIENSQMDGMSVRSALDLLIQQDGDLSEYLNKPFHGNMDKLFEAFYMNLRRFTGKETEFESRLNDYEDDDIKKINKGIEFKAKEKAIELNGEKYTVYFEEIITPKTELFIMLNDGEGGYSAGINYNYLAEKYSKALSIPWKVFLKNQQKEFNDRDNGTYYSDGIPPSQDILANWLLIERSFLNKYPDFPLNDIIKDNIKTFSSDVLIRGYLAFENKEDGSVVLHPKVKSVYEKFLANGDKNSQEYKEIKNWYDALKKNDFKENSNLYKYLYELTGDKNDKETYENMKKQEIEQAKQKAEENKLKQLEAKETWKKVGKHLYFNPNSLEKKGANSGIFKTYYTQDTAPDYFDVVPAYEVTKVSCDCENEYLYIEQSEYFDKDNKYIDGNYPRAFADTSYKEYENGKIYFNVLCNR